MPKAIVFIISKFFVLIFDAHQEICIKKSKLKASIFWTSISEPHNTFYSFCFPNPDILSFPENPDNPENPYQENPSSNLFK